MGSGQEMISAKIRWFVYLSHALSTWGDRMWSFGVGLFMVIISPESLRVTAVYGLSMGCGVLLFGALVGDWVDRTPRLKAARTSLVIQNISVILCAGVVYVVITFKTQIQAVWPNEGLLMLCYVVIILIAMVAMLGSMGTHIAVQKDWIVEICGRDKETLATMTATLRRIDLFNLLVAPIATGQIMYFASVGFGALFIAGWNLVSVFVEYVLLWKVYTLVPALRRAKPDSVQTAKSDDQEEAAQEMMTLNSNQDNDLDPESQNAATNSNMTEVINGIDTGTIWDKSQTMEKSPDEVLVIDNSQKKKVPVVRRIFSGFITLYRGWRTYMKYNVAYAGLGLAALYMTVLGFDNITIGFAYTQGINESLISIAMAAGAVSGILGTFLYPVIRKQIGLERTGLFGFLFEVSFLCLCVASVWAPGSPFNLLYWKDENTNLEGATWNMECNASIPHLNITMDTVLNGTAGMISYNVSDVRDMNATLLAAGSMGNITVAEKSNIATKELKKGHSYVSIWLLLAGIIGARCGLWMADLTISQLFLENIKENERGIVNGVQTSLNKLMDMLKFIMVIAAPREEVFGILIIISFSFIVLGWILYAKYSRSIRGHLFHFDKIRKCYCTTCNNNNIPRVTVADDGQ